MQRALVIFNAWDSSSLVPIFTADLLAAKREVVIVSPFLTQSRVSKMLDTLKGCMLSGEKLTVVTKPAGDCSDKDAAECNELYAFCEI